MTVYNVSGTMAALGASEKRALSLLQGRAQSVEMDIMDVRAEPNGPASEPYGYIASGVVTGLFEADSEEAATARFLQLVYHQVGALPQDVRAFESEDVPREWVR